MAHGSPLREPNNNENGPEDGAQAVSRFHIACQLRTLTVRSMVTGKGFVVYRLLARLCERWSGFKTSLVSTDSGVNEVKLPL